MSETIKINELLAKFKQGDSSVLGRVISIVENYPDLKRTLFSQLPSKNNAYILGVTGPPGVGKSSLINLLTHGIRAEGRTVGVIAVDPTSPFTGGAFLGDRIRMQSLVLDPGVFIRSLGSRGAVGGVSKATFDVALVLDAFGKDVIIIETVGAGQTEIDILGLADTIVGVTFPGMGDSMQVLKAGIIEITDILVVNKDDLGGDTLAVKFNELYDTYCGEGRWRPPVIKTNALTGKGIGDLIGAIWQHKEFTEQSGLLKKRRKEHIEARIVELLEDKVKEYVLKEIIKGQDLQESFAEVIEDRSKIYAVVGEKVDKILAKIKLL